MSLMNQVLRDLQHRKAGLAGATFQDQINPVHFVRRQHWLMIWGGVFLVALVAALLLLSRQTRTHSQAVVSSPAVVKTQSEPVTTKSAGLAESRLKAVHLQSGPSSTRILLELSKDFVATPVLHRNGHRLTVNLPQMVPDFEKLPQPAPTDFLIDHVALTSLENIWQLVIVFKAAVRTEYFILDADSDYGQRLVIDVFAQTVKRKKISPRPDLLPPEINTAAPVSSSPALIKQKSQPTIQEQVDDLYRRGLLLIKSQQKNEGLTLWGQALRLNPERTGIRKKMISILLETAPARADQLFRQGVSLTNSHDFRKWYARTLLTRQGPAAALTVLAGQEVQAADDHEYLALQAGLWQQVGNYALAARNYRNLLDEYPENSLYLFGLALALDQQAEQEKALELYRNALTYGLKTDLQRYARMRVKVLAQEVEAGN